MKGPVAPPSEATKSIILKIAIFQGFVHNPPISKSVLV